MPEVRVFPPVLQLSSVGFMPFIARSLSCFAWEERLVSPTAESKISQRSKEDSHPTFLLCLDIQAEPQILPSETLSVDLKGLLLPADVLFKNSLVHDN